MAKHSSSTSKVVTLIVLTVLGMVFWQVAPLFLPRFRWTHVDFDEIAKQASAKGTPLTAAQAATQFDIEFCYLPRAKEGDPRPWVLLKMTPPWHQFTGDDDNNEEGRMVRCTIISDRTGEPPGGYLLGSEQYKDRFFKAKAWRFPPGTFNMDKERPIILVDMMSLEKFDIGQAQVISVQLRDPRIWEPDDDGFEPNTDK
jgi:hypothetical protein